MLGIGRSEGENHMTMIFEFPKTKREQAEAFVQAVKEKFGLDGWVFDVPEPMEPPVVHIERVDIPDSEADIKQLKKRFGLTRKLLDKHQLISDHLDHVRSLRTEGVRGSIAVTCAAEETVEKLAETFGGTFVGT